MHHLTSDQRYRLLAAHALEHAMVVMDTAGIIVEWSAGTEKLLGWTAEEAIGRDSSFIFTQEDREAQAAEEELGIAKALGRAADIRWHVRKDGSQVFCDGVTSVLYDNDGKTVIGFGKVMREAYVSHWDQQKHPSTELPEQRSFLAAVMESVEDAIVACDAKGKLTFFNDATRKLHGLPEKPLPPEKWAEHYQLYRPDGVTPLPIEEIPLYRALKGEHVRNAEMVVAPHGAKPRTLLASGRPLQDGRGNILGAVVSMNDITDRREAQHAKDQALREQAKREEAERIAEVLRIGDERLRLAEDQLRIATEAAELGIWIWEIDKDKVSWENDRLWEIFGVPRNSGTINVAQFLSEVIHPDDAKPYQNALERSVNSGERLYFAGRFFKAPNRELRWFEFTGLLQPAKDGTPRRLIGTAADITQRKLAEEALNETRTRLEAILAASEVATWILDIKADRVTADRNLAKLFGISEEVAAGAPVASYLPSIHPEDVERVLLLLQDAIKNKESYRASYRVRDAEGKYRWVIASGGVILDEQGNPASMPGVLLDITKQHEMEEALRTTQEQYRSLITSMDAGFCVIEVIFDAQGKPVDYRFIEVNPAFEQQTGLFNAVGKTIKELVPNIEEHWVQTYGKVVQTGEPVRFAEEAG